jgi:AAA domain
VTSSPQQERLLHVSVFTDAQDRSPSAATLTWSRLAGQLRPQIPTANACTTETCPGGTCPKKNGTAWSPARYPEGATRGKANVLSVCAAVLDLDHLADDVAVETARTRFAGIRHVLHSSHSDRPGDRCLRLVLDLTRDVPAADWPRFWLQLAEMSGLPYDPQCSDASRIYFLPTRPQGSTSTYILEDGEPLDVDTVLAMAPVLPVVAFSAPIPADAGPIAPDALMAAVEAVATMWPRGRANGGPGGRYHAGLALCGALARQGWPEDRIAEFVACVAEIEEPGNAELWRWESAARATVAKVQAGESVTGWGTLIAEHGFPGEAVERVRGHLGMEPSKRGDPKFLEAMQAVVAAAEATQPEGVALDQHFRALLNEAVHDVITTLAATGAGDGEVKPLFEPAGALMCRDFPPAPWLVERLITEGAVTAIAGEPKTGKSWGACEIAMAVATGTPVWGKFRVPRARKVAYFFAEDMGQSIRNRLRALAASRSMDSLLAVEGLYVQPRGRNLDITREADLAVIVASCRRLGKIDLLILDPLRDVHSGKEDKSDDMAQVMRHVRVLAQLLGCAVIFVHHMGKSTADSSKRRQGQKMRGSSAVHGSVDCGIYLTGLTGDGETEFTNDVLSEVKGAKSGGSFGLELKVTDDEHHEAISCSWRVIEASSKQIPASKEADGRVMEVVHALFTGAMFNGEVKPMSLDMIRKKMSGRREVVQGAVDTAHRMKYIHNVMVGVKSAGWILTETGREAFRQGMSGGTQVVTEASPMDPALAGHLAGALAQPEGKA